MQKKDFYILRGSVDPNITGVKTISQIDDFIDPENSDKARITKYQLPDTNSFIGEEYDLQKFKLQATSKNTNILTTRFLDSVGIFVSPKLYNIIKQYPLYKTNIVPIELFQNGTKTPYFFVNCISSEDLVDYEKSTCFATHNRSITNA